MVHGAVDVTVQPQEMNLEACMRMVSTAAMFSIGGLLLLYVVSIGRIWNNHSVQNYLLLCTGIISIVIGFLAIAMAARDH